MLCNASPRFRKIAVGLCLLCCVAKIVALAVVGSSLVTVISELDYRLPLIAAGWTCIGLATFLMLRTNRELAPTAACCRSKRKP